MKITVIGAGAIGSAVANDLLADADVAQVCDARTLQALRNGHVEVRKPEG